MINRKRAILLLIPVLFLVFFQTTGTNFILDDANAASKLEIIPPEFSTAIPITNIDTVPAYSMQLISTDNINNVTAIFSSLRAEEGGKMWIPRNAITTIPTVFNLSKGKVTNLDIVMKLPNETGTYRGTVTLMSSDGILDVVDTKIVIFQPIPTLSIIAVATGVFVAFLLRYVKTRMTIRSSVLEVIEKFRTSSLKAHRAGRVDTNFRTGNEEAQRALGYFKAGDFEYAKQAMENAIESMNSAKSPPGAQAQSLKGKFFNEMFDEVRQKMGLRSLFRQQNGVVFFLTSAAVFIVILQTWLQVYNQITTSGESFLGIIVAFLLGYGSQSLLGEAFDTKPQ